MYLKTRRETPISNRPFLCWISKLTESTHLWPPTIQCSNFCTNSVSFSFSSFLCQSFILKRVLCKHFSSGQHTIFPNQLFYFILGMNFKHRGDVDFKTFLPNWPTGPIRSSSRDVCPYIWLSHQKIGNFSHSLSPHWGLFNHIWSVSVISSEPIDISES